MKDESIDLGPPPPVKLAKCLDIAAGGPSHKVFISLNRMCAHGPFARAAFRHVYIQIFRAKVPKFFSTAEEGIGNTQYSPPEKEGQARQA